MKAASELAFEIGPGNLSLDAVAARAGLSKGGLLYNFPSKAKLLEAVVEEHLVQFRKDLESEIEARRGSPNPLASAYLSLVSSKPEFENGPPSGLLAAMAENPDFMEPVRRFNREMLDRIAASPGAPSMALIALLAVEGLRLTQLLGTDVLTADERANALDALAKLLG